MFLSHATFLSGHRRLRIPPVGRQISSCLMAWALGSFTYGCAAYRASRLPIYPASSCRSFVDQGPVLVGAEQWYSKPLSKLYFDTNLTKRGVVPVHVVVENQGETPIKLRVAQLRLAAQDFAEPLAPISFDESAERMRRKSAGPAVAWGVLGLATLFFAFIFVPIGSALAISQTSSVNERLKQDIWNKSLKDADVPAGGTARGVVFFAVPDDVERLAEPRLVCSMTIGEASMPLQFEVPL